MGQFIQPLCLPYLELEKLRQNHTYHLPENAERVRELLLQWDASILRRKALRRERQSRSTFRGLGF